MALQIDTRARKRAELVLSFGSVEHGARGSAIRLRIATKTKLDEATEARVAFAAGSIVLTPDVGSSLSS
jgi:hypothetical protein